MHLSVWINDPYRFKRHTRTQIADPVDIPVPKASFDRICCKKGTDLLQRCGLESVLLAFELSFCDWPQIVRRVEHWADRECLVLLCWPGEYADCGSVRADRSRGQVQHLVALGVDGMEEVCHVWLEALSVEPVATDAAKVCPRDCAIYICHHELLGL